MLLLIYILGVMFTMHNDALACYVANHKYNIKGSSIAALFWFASVPMCIFSVYKQQKDKE